jgi:hypothetical protein
VNPVNSSARHARRKETRRAALLLRAGLTAAATGAVVAGAGVAGGGTAWAAPSGAGAQANDTTTTTDTAAGLGRTTNGLLKGLGSSVDGAATMAKNHQINPLGKTPVDPLNNGVGTQVGDFKPIGTQTVTDPLHNGAALGDLPVVGALLGK